MLQHEEIKFYGLPRTRLSGCLLTSRLPAARRFSSGRASIREIASGASALFGSQVDSTAGFQAPYSGRLHRRFTRNPQNQQHGASQSTNCSTFQSSSNFDVSKSHDTLVPQISCAGASKPPQAISKDEPTDVSGFACKSLSARVKGSSMNCAGRGSRSAWFRANRMEYVRISEGESPSENLWSASEGRKSITASSDFKRQVKSSNPSLATLARVQCEAGMPGDALESVKQMTLDRNGPRRVLYNDLLRILVNSYPPQKASWLYKRMLAVGYRPDACTFNILLGGFGKAGNVGAMKHLLKEMKEKSCDPTAVTYGILVDVLCKAGRVDEAFTLFNANKLVANVVVYNAMLHGLGKAGRIAHALELYKEMRDLAISPQVNTCNIVIQSLGLANQPEDAFNVFREMPSLGVAPDVFTYNVLLKILVRERLFDRALNLLEDMTKSKCSPDLVSYGTVIVGLGETGDADRARDLFQRVISAGLKPNGIIYGAFISALCKGGRLNEAVVVYEGMESAGCVPDATVSTIICDHLFRAGRVDAAQRLFEGTGIKDERTHLMLYNSAIHVLGKSGDLDRLLSLLREMSSRGCEPDVVTYNTVMVHLGKAGMVDGACKLLHDMQASGCSPDVVSYSTLVDVLCKHGRSSQALELFKEMRIKGVVPNVFTYGSLIRGLCRAGHFGTAHVIYEEMIDTGCSPNVVAYHTIIQSFSSSPNHVKNCFDLFKEMTEKGYSSSPLTSYLLMRALRKAGRVEDAKFVKTKSPEIQGSRSLK